jgi:hypothetical protein
MASYKQLDGNQELAKVYIISGIFVNKSVLFRLSASTLALLLSLGVDFIKVGRRA